MVVSKKYEIELRNFLAKLSAEILLVTIEPTNICNANCSFCANKYLTRERRIMDLTTYKNIIDQVKTLGVRQLKFTPLIGDPLMDPLIIDKIKYGKSLNCFDSIYTYTNLIGLDKYNVYDLVNSGLTAVSVSTCLQGREDFKRIMGVDKFITTMANILKLLKINQDCHSPIAINISLRHDRNFDLSNNVYYHEILKFTREIEVLNDNYDNWCGLVGLKDLPFGQTFRMPPAKVAPCSQLYNGFIVTANGDIGACWTRDVNLDLCLGNIADQPLQDIWSGEQIKKLREQWLKGDIPYPCKDCLQYTSVLDHPLIYWYLVHYWRQYFLIFLKLTWIKLVNYLARKFVQLKGKM